LGRLIILAYGCGKNETKVQFSGRVGIAWEGLADFQNLSSHQFPELFLQTMTIKDRSPVSPGIEDISQIKGKGDGVWNEKVRIGDRTEKAFL
jgi:hypothetical protein